MFENQGRFVILARYLPIELFLRIAMGSGSYKTKYAILGAMLVPCFGRLALHGTGYEHDLYRYFVPLFVGGLAGFLIGFMKDKLLLSNKYLGTANEALRNKMAEQKLVEEALKESEERLKRYLETIDSMGVGIFIVDSDYHIRHMNKTMTKWFGDQTGLNCHQSIAGLDTPCDYCQIKPVIDLGKTINYNPTTPDGRTFDITCSRIRNSDGSISKMEIIRDITERKKAETALMESESKFRGISETSMNAIYQLDTKGFITFINEMGEEMYGYEPGEMTGLHFSSLISKKRLDEANQMVGRVLSGANVEGELYVNHKNGNEFPIQFSMVPLFKDEKIVGFTGMSRDITARKQVEKKREELIKELQKALSEIKTLKGILPICANCKKIRDDKGYWKQIESYLRDHSGANFSHGICPDCAKKLYPDLDYPD